MPRSTGSLTPAWFSDPNVVRAFYLRMDWGGTIGTLRWTTKQTYPATVDARDMGDGAGTVNWDGTKAWGPGGIQEGDSFTVTDVTFENQANEFSDLVYLGGGIRGVPFQVWCAGFNNAAPHAYVDKFKLFTGEGERAEISDTVRVSLTPLKHPMNLQFPRRRFTLAHGFKFLPPPNLKAWWGSTHWEAYTPTPNQTGVPGPQIGYPRGGVTRVPNNRQTRTLGGRNPSAHPIDPLPPPGPRPEGD